MDDVGKSIENIYRFWFGHYLFNDLTHIYYLEYIERNPTKGNYYIIKGAIENLKAYRRYLIHLKNVIERKLGFYNPINAIKLTHTLI